MKQYNSAGIAGVGRDNPASDIDSSLMLPSSKLILLVVFITVLVFILTACSPTYAPVEQRSIKPYKSRDYYSQYSKKPENYSVRKGDTLFSIAWNYGLDYKSLARWNNISSPYTIYVGKNLRLKPGKTTNYKTGSVKSVPKQSKIKKNKRDSPKTGTNSKKAQSNVLTPTSRHTAASSSSQNKKKSQTKKTDSRKTASTAKYNKNNTAKSTGGSYSGNKPLHWRWPVKGKILQSYAPAKGKKGIDIGAKQGTHIRAAEGGKIVYSGQGLRGYGLLLIIKHNETFLSAYAHNQSLLANEGQMVKRGQAIARMGNTGTDRTKLHFEIRKNGQPVNPLNYLP